jgi:hypothetical protein
MRREENEEKGKKQGRERKRKRTRKRKRKRGETTQKGERVNERLCVKEEKKVNSLHNHEEQRQPKRRVTLPLDAERAERFEAESCLPSSRVCS